MRRVPPGVRRRHRADLGGLTGATDDRGRVTAVAGHAGERRESLVIAVHRVDPVGVALADRDDDVARVVERLGGAQAGYEVLVAGADRCDHVCSAERGQLDRERPHSAGRTDDQYARAVARVHGHHRAHGRRACHRERSGVGIRQAVGRGHDRPRPGGSPARRTSRRGSRPSCPSSRRHDPRPRTRPRPRRRPRSFRPHRSRSQPGTSTS